MPIPSDMDLHVMRSDKKNPPSQAVWRQTGKMTPAILDRSLIQQKRAQSGLIGRHFG